MDRREAELPRVGLLRLQDLESGTTVVIDTSSAAVRRAYQQRQTAVVAQRQQLFQSLGIDAIEVRTDEPYINPMMRFFRRRERRR